MTAVQAAHARLLRAIAAAPRRPNRWHVWAGRDHTTRRKDTP